ncbi:MAG: ATP synthase F1 subunit delta [Phycisphaerae bacterium]
MAAVTDQDLAIARVYSAAMLELAESQGEVDFLLGELTDFVHALGRLEGLASFVSDPTIDPEARRRTIEKLFRGRYSDLLVDSLQILNRKGRLGMIEAVAEAYRMAQEELRGRVTVVVRTAAPLSKALRDRLSAVIAKRTGKDPDLIEQTDESLLGGLVVRLGDDQFDGSVASDLKRLGRVLAERASHEIHSGRTYVEGGAV